MKKPQTENIAKFSGMHLRHFSKIIFMVFSFTLLFGYTAIAQSDTLITVRFSNPQFDCDNEKYCVDVEALSNLPNQILFGINVRFFYDDFVLEYDTMVDFATGYEQVPPLSPITTGAGTAFTFPGGHQADFLNRNVELVLPPGIEISTDDDNWTKLFSVCFIIDDPNSIDISSFCPSLVWDMDVDPAFGGFGNASNGVVITVVGENEASRPVTENVEQFNWVYTGTLAPPFGYPDPTDCTTTICALFDMGDAPENAMAYPDKGVIGAFPTCLDENGWYITHLVSEFPLMFFGPAVDGENDGNGGQCSPYSPYNNDEYFNDTDAGLLTPAPYTISGGGYVAYSPGSTLASAGDTIYWGPNLDILVSNNSQGMAYVNVLIDWNRNGIWQNDPGTTFEGNFIPEHCLVNFPVPQGFTGPLSALAPPQIYAGPFNGHMWARFSITEGPVQQTDNSFEPGWNGTGEFLDGETEDYLFFVSPNIPLSDWALAIGIFLIAALTILRLRRS